jgi:hypothetical protein
MPLELTLNKCGSFFAEQSALFLGNLFTQPTLAHTVHTTVRIPFRRLHYHNHHYHPHHNHNIIIIIISIADYKTTSHLKSVKNLNINNNNTYVYPTDTAAIFM